MRSISLLCLVIFPSLSFATWKSSRCIALVASSFARVNWEIRGRSTRESVEALRDFRTFVLRYDPVDPSAKAKEGDSRSSRRVMRKIAQRIRGAERHFARRPQEGQDEEIATVGYQIHGERNIQNYLGEIEEFVQAVEKDRDNNIARLTAFRLPAAGLFASILFGMSLNPLGAGLLIVPASTGIDCVRNRGQISAYRDPDLLSVIANEGGSPEWVYQSASCKISRMLANALTLPTQVSDHRYYRQGLGKQIYRDVSSLSTGVGHAKARLDSLLGQKSTSLEKELEVSWVLWDRLVTGGERPRLIELIRISKNRPLFPKTVPADVPSPLWVPVPALVPHGG